MLNLVERLKSKLQWLGTNSAFYMCHCLVGRRSTNALTKKKKVKVVPVCAMMAYRGTEV